MVRLYLTKVTTEAFKKNNVWKIIPDLLDSSINFGQEVHRQEISIVYMKYEGKTVESIIYLL